MQSLLSASSVLLWIVPTVPIAAIAWLRRAGIGSLFSTTMFWLIAEFVGDLVAYVTFLVLLASPTLRATAAPATMRSQMLEGGWMALALIVSSPFAIAVFAGAVRIMRQRFADYFALRWPTARELARGLAMMAALVLIWHVAGYLTDQKAPEYVIDGYRIAKQSGWLPVYLFAVCIAAPITEEFSFRGFLFRGWSQSALGPIGAIVLTSAIWAAMHTQYGLFGVSDVFASGLLLGYLRHRSGSIWLTVVIHAVTNVVSMIELAVTEG